jgi:hypothetical protein
MSTSARTVHACTGAHAATAKAASPAAPAPRASPSPGPLGYEQRDGKCVDIDECKTANGGCVDGRTCSNSEGGHACGACPDGYRANGALGCEDVDSCAVANGGCDRLTKCTDLLGGRACGACPSGYTGDGLTGCVDIDECAMDNGGCSALRACVNQAGAHFCSSCPSGYANDGATGCADVDECAFQNGGCASQRACINQPGAHMCAGCSAGYANVGDKQCQDIDECLTNHGGCDPRVTCTNRVGSRTCGACPRGFQGTGDTACVDIDECASNNGGCDPLKPCINGVGASSCGACPAGYDAVDATCVPRLLGLKVSKHASLDIPLNTPTNRSNTHDIQWAPFGPRATLAFVVAEGVNLTVNGRAVAAGEPVEVDEALGQKQTLLVEVLGANGRSRMYTFYSRRGCGMQKRAEIARPANGFPGATVKVFGNTLIAGTSRDGTSSSYAIMLNMESGTTRWYSPKIWTGGDGPAFDMRGSRFVMGYASEPSLRDGQDGAVRVYDQAGASVPRLTDEILPSEPGTKLGMSVALADDLLAIASFVPGSSTETLISIRRWSEGQLLRPEVVAGPPSPSVKLVWSGDRLVAYAPKQPVRVYELVGPTWQETARIELPEGADNFGTALAYDEANDAFVIGAPLRDAQGTLGAMPGRAYVYGSASDGYPFLFTLRAPDGSTAQQFGQSVAMGDDFVAVGAPGLASTDLGGAVFVYWLSGDDAELCDTLTGQYGFGAALDAEGQLLGIGSPKSWSTSAHAMTVGQWNLQP